MQLVDVNVLLYAIDERSPRHADARGWLDSALSGGETVAFTWAVLLAFVRLSTNASLFTSPLSAEQALDIVDLWLAQPTSIVVEPGPRHIELVRSLLTDAGTAGNLVSDAHLAAIALETGAELVSYDTDFERFSGVRRLAPA